MIWCPYTDNEIDVSATTPEHIVPLALGGSNAFTVPVEARFNSTVGSSIDGVIANDFLMSFRRRELDARGHSNKPPETKVRRATFGDSKKPAQVTFQGQEGVAVWDAKAQRMLDEHEKVGQEMSVQVNISVHDRLRFLAKVSLSAGYFIYGEQFRANAEHGSLRALMNLPPGQEDRAEKELELRGLRAYHEFSPIAEADEEQVRIQRLLCQVPGSVVIAIPGKSSIGFVIGILGQWFGATNVPAQTDGFPMDGDHDLGQAVVIVDGQMQKLSYRQLCIDLYTHLNGTPPDLAGTGGEGF